jgi:methyl-accepting chemotaxis protein
MLSRINSHLSLGTRLALLCAVFMGPIVVLLWLFVSNQLTQRAFSSKELAGAAYEVDIWRAIRTDAPLADGGSAFAATDAYRAFVQATPGAGRTAAGAALVGAVADGSNLTLDPELASFYVMDAETVRLPTLLSAEASMVDAAKRGDHNALQVARSDFLAAAEDLQHSVAVAGQHDSEARSRLAPAAAALAQQTA